jgi:hypothetical protein
VALFKRVELLMEFSSENKNESTQLFQKYIFKLTSKITALGQVKSSITNNPRSGMHRSRKVLEYADRYH